MAPPSTRDRYRGCLLGGAVGDALGAAVEFLSLEEIRAQHGPDGIADPAEAYGVVGAITDDTQMTLFTAEGLLQADDRLKRGIGYPPTVVWAAYQRWLATQEGRAGRPDDAFVWHGELHRIDALWSRRAPGGTCLGALRASGAAVPERGTEAAANDSKGCGGVMRAAPCGLVPWTAHEAPGSTFRVGVMTAALTHGHPSGSIAAGALATIVELLVAGRSLEGAVDDAIARSAAEPGGDEVAAALRAAVSLARDGDPSPERLTAALGEGWVAEEALAIAVYAVLAHPTDVEAALRLAVNHRGDSDSTGAIAGNIAGALLGVDAIPPRWLATLELRDTIDRLAVALHDRFVDRVDDVDWSR